MSIDEGGIPEPGPEGEDPFDVVLDEDFIRSATTKEPSARARELKARWAQNPPGETEWRAGGPIDQDSDPEPEDAEGAQKRRRERRPRDPGADGPDAADSVGGTGASGEGRQRRPWLPTLAVTLVLVSVAIYLLHPKRLAPGSVNSSPPAVAEPTAGGSGQPSERVSFTDPDDKYFVGSPSLDWSDNAAGITPPAAAAVGGFSAATVAGGYRQMELLLVKGDLDATILGGGAVAGFFDLIDPMDQAVLDDLSASLATPSAQHDPIAYVTRFDPATTRVLGHTVKVDGSMSASVNRDGVLLITGDYRFVYPVGPARGDAAPTRTLVHRLYQLAIFPAGSSYTATAGKAWLYAEDVSTANDACHLYNGFVNPVFGTGGAAKATKTVDPYASQNLLPTAAPSGPATAASGSANECAAASRV